jgi:hypothetical protein
MTDKQDRSAGRNRVMLSAALIVESGEVKVRVRDLSRIGAKLVSDALIQADTDVILRHRNLFAAATVKWVRDGEIGIEFYRKQDLEVEKAA